MEVFCIHEKDKVPATQESWRRCKTERRRQEPVVFVTWSKQKSRRRDWEHFRLLFERHAPSVQLELPISKWHFKGRERGNGGPPTPTPACLHQRVRPRPLRWPSEEGTRNRAADAQGGGSWARRGRAGEGDMMRARRPPHFLPVDIAREAFTAGGTEPPRPRAGFLHAAGPGPGLCDPPPLPVAWGPPV